MVSVNDVRVWFERDLRYASWESEVQIIGTGAGVSAQGESGELRLRIYTDNNQYNLSAIVEAGGRTYLGCTAWARKPRAGEDGGRGNDLPDGPLTEDTWRKILGAIVGYELVKVHRPAPPVLVTYGSEGHPAVNAL